MTTSKRSATQPIYRDPTADVESRVRDLLGRMTLDEKVRQMGTVLIKDCLENGKVSRKALREHFGDTSVGALADPRLEPADTAKAVNAVQKYLVEHTRLGIPGLVHGECLHGYMSPGATIFPQAIGLGSTWNPELIRSMSEVAAAEGRTLGAVQALSPDLDLARDPRWGRVEETYGEDPYLASRMGVAYIKGMQGPGPTIDSRHMLCTPKHYAAHGSPESGINLAPVPGSLRDLYTLYLPPFKAAVTEAGALSVMPAYSEFEGVPASASKLLMTRVLREEWGFQGFTFSDYGAVHMLHSFHKTACCPAEAGKQALEAGMDLEAPREYGFGQALLGLVRKGEVAVELVDLAVSRMLRVKFLAGLFENPYADLAAVPRVVNCSAHRKLARKVAEESIILLKNENALLPLKKNLDRIAVIGPNADALRFGDYSVPKAGTVTVLGGIRAAVSKKTEVLHAQGCEIYGGEADFHEAIAAAEQSDVAVVVIGGMSDSLGGIGWGTDDTPSTCGEGFDLHDLAPPGLQADLVKAVHATGTPTVVVLIHGRPHSITWMAEHIPAIVEGWYVGEEGAHALADILFGKVNPSGKLPITVPRSVGHVPTFYNHKPSSRGCYHKPGNPEEPGRDYVFSDPAPLFEFGHGLSYTKFRYSALRLSPAVIAPAGRATVRVDVRNAGKVAGKEVVQLYINDVYSSITTPVKVLRRFAKIELQPGEKRTLEFVLTPEDLALLDANMNWTVEPGEFEVMIGGLKKTLEVRPPAV